MQNMRILLENKINYLLKVKINFFSYGLFYFVMKLHKYIFMPAICSTFTALKG